MENHRDPELERLTRLAALPAQSEEPPPHRHLLTGLISVRAVNPDRIVFTIHAGAETFEYMMDRRIAGEVVNLFNTAIRDATPSA